MRGAYRASIGRALATPGTGIRLFRRKYHSIIAFSILRSFYYLLAVVLCDLVHVLAASLYNKY